MRSFSRQLRNAAHRSYEALRPHWSSYAHAVDTTLTDTHTFSAYEDPSRFVKVDLSGTHMHSPEVSSSATSSSSSLAMDDSHRVKFSHALTGQDLTMSTIVSTPSRCTAQCLIHSRYPHAGVSGTLHQCWMTSRTVPVRSRPSTH